MAADANDKPSLKEPEAEVLDFEVVDDGHGGGGGSRGDSTGQGFSPEDMAAMAPDMLVQVFRGMIKEKLKRWFIRSLVWATVLLFFAQEHTWARWAFGIWAFIAGVHLAFLLYGWYASGKQGARLAQVLGGIPGMNNSRGQIRED